MSPVDKRYGEKDEEGFMSIGLFYTTNGREKIDIERRVE